MPPRSPRLFAGDRQVKVIALDGWTALGAFVPPKERRGLVLIDPPFEERDEFDRLLAGLVKAHRRWPSGIYALWYPVKDLAATKRFRAGLAESGLPRLLRAELTIRKRTPASSPAPVSSSPTRPGGSRNRSATAPCRTRTDSRGRPRRRLRIWIRSPMTMTAP